MLPYILAAVGGYLIGDSMKSQSFADGGIMADGGTMAKGGEIGDEVTLLKGYGYRDLNKYGDFQRFKGGEKGVFIKGNRKLGNEIVLKLNDGRNIITVINAIDLPTIEEKEELYKKNKHLFSFGYSDGGIMADGGQFDYGFTIRQMNETLMSKFPDSFGFNVYPVDTKELNMGVLKIFPTVSFYGLTDSEINSKLYFPQYKRDHEINYHIRQGSENTYFDFLLEDENGKYYVGTFGFKDQGMVPASYITEFIAFLQEAYGLPFTIEHTVK